MIRLSVASTLRFVTTLAGAALCVAPVSAWALSCTVSTLPANFGSYNPLLAAPVSTTGEIDVACNCSGVDCAAFSYRIEISAGASGNTAAREMRAGSSSLRYNLYSDPGYSTIWGTGSAGSSTLYLVALFGSKQSATVYARMPGGQSVAAGSYADTPVVTISY